MKSQHINRKKRKVVGKWWLRNKKTFNGGLKVHV